MEVGAGAIASITCNNQIFQISVKRDSEAQLTLKCKIDFEMYLMKGHFPISLQHEIFNHMMSFPYHIESTDNLDIKATANDFIRQKNHVSIYLLTFNPSFLEYLLLNTKL